MDHIEQSQCQNGPPYFEFTTITTRAIWLALRSDSLPKLTIACAAPGFGKTVLLSRIFEKTSERGEDCWWVSLSERDADLPSLMYKIRAAIAHSLPEESAADIDLGMPLRARAWSTEGIIKWFSNLKNPGVLFIDNLGFCEDSELEAFLDRLVFHTPPNLRIVLASTTEIPVDTSRARLELSVLELRTPQLSFDSGNVALMLEHIGVGAVCDADISRIVARTEGWPAAVRLLQVLVGESIEDGAIVPTLNTENLNQWLSGDQQQIAEFLTRRLLVSFPSEFVQFMCEIALLSEFNADIAISITGNVATREWLDVLIRRNVLIFPLDKKRRWLRFHSLLREFLLAEGKVRISPLRRTEVLTLAATWHVEHGEKILAIDLALDGGNIALAQELVDGVNHVIVGDQGRMATLIRWVDRLQDAGVTLSVETQAWFIFALCDSLQYERASSAVEKLDRQVANNRASVPNDWDTPARLLFARIMVNVWLDRLDIAFQQAESWLARNEPIDSLTLAAVISTAAIAEMDRGEMVSARLRMAKASAAISRSDSAYGLGWVSIFTACVDIEQARPDLANAMLTEARIRIVQQLGEDADVVHTLDFVHSRAMLDLGRTEEARMLVRNGLNRATKHGMIVSLEQGLAATTVFGMDGNVADKSTLDSELERVAFSYPERGQTLLAARRIRQSIQNAKFDDARSIAIRHLDHVAATQSSGPVKMNDRGEWLLARLELLLVQGDCEKVLKEIQVVLKIATLQERNRDAVELHLLAADAHYRLGQWKMAGRRLSIAIVLATPGNLIHPFRVRSFFIEEILKNIGSTALGLTKPNEWSFLDLLRPLTFGDRERNLKTIEVIKVEQIGAAKLLSAREITLLSLLDEGLNNDQVADRVSLSVPTVKWHLHKAYVKLGVRSRSAAIARARSMNLLSRSGKIA